MLLRTGSLYAQPQQSVLRPAGVQAANIAKLWDISLIVCGIVFALVLLATLVALLRNSRQASGAGQAAGPPDLSSLARPEHRTRALVIGASVLSVFVLVGLIVADVLTDRALSKLPVDDPVRIDMIGAQWWWQAAYRAQDGQGGFVTANELHVPVGRPIVVSLQATDVIHSFWVPNLHGKKDMLPGIDTTIEFRADQPGTYRGQCAEYCGAEHALMAMLVIADPPEHYAAWVARQTQSAVQTGDAITLHGRDVFERASCANCHTIRGTSAIGTTGPDLTHLMSRETMAAGVLANTPQNLAAWIRNPQALKPGATMPAVPLSDDDRAAVVRWLSTLQ
ncbi:cytochrome c oxidase subunit II [Paraburkholderia tropica]|uniref:cytochrome-c oxidase n=1 Tax=Paraburkholderia tropica TaxID=92647 RepID=A0ABX5MF30_9BURK|nr:cytochrome c oxidase subunit II [Paraburkholderia tropica]PXX07051.1 cytochrome c oxidase subunit 2 [Paraburkholderia tropica]PZW72488.1 cytochrome c oxidase subunit 2 [Paraburkholderia tropica]